MIFLTSLKEHIGRLVHPDARASEYERARHETFTATRLGLFLVAVAALPVSLACGHVPALWEAVALALLCVPIAAVAYVSRTGRLERGQLVCALAWLCFAATISLGGGLSLAGAWGVMLLAPLEAAFGSRPRLVAAAALATLSAALLLGLTHLVGLVPVGQVGRDAVVVGPAVVYACVLAVAAAWLRSLREGVHRRGERRSRVLSEAIGDLVLRYDRAGGVLMASREAEALFGIAPRDLLGRGFLERVHVADRPAFLKLFSDAAMTGENVSASLRLRVSQAGAGVGASEEPRFAWIEVRARRFDAAKSSGASAVLDPAIVAIVRDITVQRQHEDAIAQARDEAERASAWKDRFLANVSHELRTPLNAIIGFSEMLASQELSPRDPAKQRDYAQIIATSGQHLLSVVNSLLDISKIEAGKFELNPESFGIASTIATCCDMVGLEAEQLGITVVRDVASNLDEIVGDKRACKQILINLLSNALKFTGRGGRVTVGARRQGTSVVITVADTGVGIASLDLARLGDAFFQVKSASLKPYEGTGLGLSVVRGLVGLHGGSIGVESAPGEGTRVTVRLPLDCGATPPGAMAARIETLDRYSASKTLPAWPETAKVHKIA